MSRSLRDSKRFVSPPAPVLAGRWELIRFTRSEMGELLRLGIVPEDAMTELLRGVIVLKDRAAGENAIRWRGRGRLFRPAKKEIMAKNNGNLDRSERIGRVRSPKKDELDEACQKPLNIWTRT